MSGHAHPDEFHRKTLHNLLLPRNEHTSGFPVPSETAFRSLSRMVGFKPGNVPFAKNWLPAKDPVAEPVSAPVAAVVLPPFSEDCAGPKKRKRGCSKSEAPMPSGALAHCLQFDSRGVVMNKSGSPSARRGEKTAKDNDGRSQRKRRSLEDYAVCRSRCTVYVPPSVASCEHLQRALLESEVSAGRKRFVFARPDYMFGE